MQRKLTSQEHENGSSKEGEAKKGGVGGAAVTEDARKHIKSKDLFVQRTVLGDISREVR